MALDKLNQSLSRFLETNLFWDSVSRFESEDKHLRDLKSIRYVAQLDWWQEITEPGVYILFGGRQVGKTTSLKEFLLHKLRSKACKQHQALFLLCDPIVDRHELYDVLRIFLTSIDREQLAITILDEITFIKDWQLSIKSLIDEGLFRNVIVLITGSDRILLEDAAQGFPGIQRRGKSGKDFVLRPLSFAEVTKLVAPQLLAVEDRDRQWKEDLMNIFSQYLNAGGYLPALNEQFTTGEISESVFNVYEQWIISDLVRKGKERRRFYDLLRVLISRIASQISYTKLAQESQHLSTDTLIDYIEHLERLDVMTVLSAFDQSTLSGFPKKEKKFYFADPFLLHVAIHILKKQGILSSKFKIDETILVENAVISNYLGQGQLYYMKAEGEVDLIVVRDGKFDPIEVKWSKRIRPEELKQIIKLKRGIVLSKQEQSEELFGLQFKYLPEYLLISNSHTTLQIP